MKMAGLGLQGSEEKLLKGLSWWSSVSWHAFSPGLQEPLSLIGYQGHYFYCFFPLCFIPPGGEFQQTLKKKGAGKAVLIEV